MKPIFKWLAAFVLAANCATASAMTPLDPALPDYHRTSGVSGNLSSVGSDTLANVMTMWAETFKRLYPNVDIQVQAAGSSTAPPALTAGTANLGPMSRPMKDLEIEAFEQKYGYAPTRIAVAIDALVVFAHKDNPIAGLTLPQVDAIFSSTRKCGAPRAITHWGQLGLTGTLAKARIQLFGRNSVSGTYGYFKEHALCDGDYRNNVNEQPGSASVVQSVSTSINSLGYSGIGYKTASVRAVPLARKAGDAFVAANPENAINGRYPLARSLYIYLNRKPGVALPPLEAEFVRMVLSKVGQQIVVRDGYIPLPSTLVEQQLRALGL